MSERIKALARHGNTIYMYTQRVYIHVLIKNIFHVVLKVLSANDFHPPLPGRPPRPLRATRITRAPQSLATPRVHRGLSPRPKVVSSQ